MTFMPTGPTSAVRATPRPTKFSLAANYDPGTDSRPSTRYPVDGGFGKFPGDGVSGGRPPLHGDTTGRSGSAEFIRRSTSWYRLQLSSNGFPVSGTANDTPLAETSDGPCWAKLGDMGVRRVTVSTPFLLELVKRRFPSSR